MRGIAELLSNILFILIPLVPVFLLFLARRTVVRRRKNTPSEQVEVSAEELEPSEQQFAAPRKYSAPEGGTFRGGRASFARTARNNTSAETHTTGQTQTPSPFQQISRYPELQKAVIFSEILGPPKALRDR